MKNKIKTFIMKHGHILAACAFVFVAVSANSPCMCPFHEPAEPAGLENFKKFNR